MRTFEWVDATSVEQATLLLAETTEQGPVLAKAGGLALLDLMREDTCHGVRNPLP